MPLLAYCLMEAASAVEKPATGVSGTELEELRESGLCCYYSRFASREQIAGVPGVEAALAFHHVVQVLFRQAGLIPFRFPTVVEDKEELVGHVREHAPRYLESLQRLRQMVQMEVRIGETQESAVPAATGREYLAGRQARAAALDSAANEFREATRAWVADWREHPTREGVRCFALVQRDAVAAFHQAAETASQSIAGSRVSGPWPPTEFLEGVKDS